MYWMVVFPKVGLPIKVALFAFFNPPATISAALAVLPFISTTKGYCMIGPDFQYLRFLIFELTLHDLTIFEEQASDFNASINQPSAIITQVKNKCLCTLFMQLLNTVLYLISGCV